MAQKNKAAVPLRFDREMFPDWDDEARKL